MNWFTGILVFLVVWWVVIFAVLPWGVRRPDSPEPGHEPGAPEQPMILRKMLITTLLTAVIWTVIYLLVSSDLLSFRDLVRQD